MIWFLFTREYFIFGPNVQCAAIIKYSVRHEELLNADETRLLQNNLTQLHIKLLCQNNCVFVRNVVSVRHDLLSKFFAVQCFMYYWDTLLCKCCCNIQYFVLCDNLRYVRKELRSVDLRSFTKLFLSLLNSLYSSTVTRVVVLCVHIMSLWSIQTPFHLLNHFCHTSLWMAQLWLLRCMYLIITTS